jgi:glycosyltransferase involved in cell wall biosynthesis
MIIEQKFKVEKKQQNTDIMMVTYNRVSLTKQTLESLIKTTNSSYNLIVVDNNSSDDTIQYLKDFFAHNFDKTEMMNGYIIKQNSENHGIAIGRNICLKLSRSDWLATIDNDVLLPNGWLGQCIDILKQNNQIAAIGVNMEGKKYPIIKESGIEFQEKPQGNLGTACMVFNRSIHLLLGYFNHLDYGKYGEEDADFGMRIRVLKLRLGYLRQNGQHIGEGKYDVGEYRNFKTAQHTKNLIKFHENCAAYYRKQKSLFISFDLEY